MKRICGSLLLQYLLVASGAMAQDDPVSIRAGVLLDGVGGVRENVTISIEDSRIVGIDGSPGPYT